MKFFVAISVALSILAAHTVVSAPTDEVDCSKIDEIIDEYGPGQGFTTRSSKYQIPMTHEEFAKRCRDMKDAVTLLRRYNSKCFTALTQQVFSTILRSRATFNDAHCNITTPDGLEAFESGKCLRENSLDKVQEAEKKFVIYSQVVLDANIPEENLRLRNACCAVLAGCKTFTNAFNEKCASHSNLYAKYLDSYKSEAMNLICPADDKLECDKLEKLKIDGVEPKSLFFLNPLLKVVKTLDH